MGSVGLEGLVKSYGAVQVVHGIDREVAEKDFVVQVGPSGCGKPTTLRMIAGLEEITAGELTIDNRRMNRVASKDRDVTMVFQNYALYRRPADLSCGQRQRVATGCAIVRHPKVFLFDELLSHPDAKLRTQMRAKIKRLPMQREGAVMTLARGLAKELGTDMRVNAFYPSMIDKDFGNIRTLDTGRRGFEANVPLKRQGHVDDLANFVLFLTCDDSAFFTGTNIDLNGGMLLS